MTSDIARVRALMAALGSRVDVERVRTLVHDGIPVPKARARHTGGGTHVYTPAKTTRAERDLAYCFRTAITDRPWLSNVALALIFYMPDRRRTDADNLEKLVMDAATKARVWHDDCQVTAKVVAVELDPVHPRTVVALCPATSSLDRTVGQRARRGRDRVLPLTPITGGS